MRRAFLLLAVVFLFVARNTAARDLSVDELKEKVTGASVQDRASLCIEISERQLQLATKLYSSGEAVEARSALRDVPAFSEMARDYAIQSRRNEKQTEIAIRKMTRKLTGLKHSVEHEDQETVGASIDRLQEIRDDLLNAMFSQTGKK